MNSRLLAALPALVFLGACQKTTAPPPKPIRPVLSMVVAQSSTNGLALAGMVQPRVQTAFAFRVLGRLIARPVNVGDLACNGMNVGSIDAHALISRESFARQLQEDAFKDGSRHRKAGPSLRSG